MMNSRVVRKIYGRVSIMSNDSWKVGQKVKTPKGLGKIIAVRRDGTAVYSLFKNNKGELEQGFHGSLPAYKIFQSDPAGFNLEIVENDDTDVSYVTLENYLQEKEDYETPPCMFCGEKSLMYISSEGLEAYRNGASVQNAFPNEPAHVREMIKTGIHPKCWDDNLGYE